MRALASLTSNTFWVNELPVRALPFVFEELFTCIQLLYPKFRYMPCTMLEQIHTCVNETNEKIAKFRLAGSFAQTMHGGSFEQKQNEEVVESVFKMADFLSIQNFVLM